ncbi:serine protease [Ruegeria sp. HKCCD6604]|uniref:trypsin-like serine peptidase n=1 Tax=Ruegeria sp. HKCCD6604 TaxID=2683000 RepID=UPI001492113A|nr:serine protease [Ruegeria sp. HKCCD6604]NOC90619.1 hypothetical protein [Ruegeria sp. HKCCD6604]
MSVIVYILLPVLLIFSSVISVDAKCLFPGEEQFGVVEFAIAPSLQAGRFINQSAFDDEVEFFKASKTALENSGLESAPRDQHARLKSILNGIGRLTVLEEQNGLLCNVPCTVWVRSKRVLATAGHCVSGNIRRIGAHFQFFREDDNGAVFVEFKDFEIFSGDSIGDKDLDFAYILLRDDLPNSVTPLPIGNDITIRNSHDLVVVGHPLGLRMFVSDRKCHATRQHPTINDFIIRHKCETLKGMSGAPILDEKDLLVVGIHTSGSKPDLGVDFINLGTLVSAIERSLSVSQKLPLNVTKRIPLFPEDNEIIPDHINALLTFGVSKAISVDFGSFEKLTTQINEILKDQKCNVSFKIDEAISFFPNSHLESESDFEELRNAPGHVKIVPQISWCGNRTLLGLAGCSANNESRSAIVRWFDLDSDYSEMLLKKMASIVLHEIGHNAGLTHVISSSEGKANFMAPTIVAKETEIRPDQCDALKRFIFRSYPQTK